MKSVEQRVKLARTARMIERHIFGALLGVLMAVILVRFLLLALEIDTWGLLVVLAVGAWSGAFISYASQQSREDLFYALRSRMPQVRAWCLKSMLWLLGTAAVIGVLTVLLSGSDVLVRAALTVLVTAIAAGLLWPLSLMLDEQPTLSAGLLGAASVLVVYCLVIPLIWELDRIDDEMWMTSFAVGFTAPWGMAALRLKQVPQVRFAAKVASVLYVLLLIVFLIAAWAPGGWVVRQGWAEFGWWMALYGAISVCCLAGWAPGKWRDWRWLGVATSALAFSVCEWVDVGRNLSALKAVVLLTSIGTVVAHTSLAGLVPLRSGQHWIRQATRFALIVTAVLINCEVLFFIPRRASDLNLLDRATGAAVIVACCGSLALLLLARLNRDRSGDWESIELTAVKLICPQCGKKQWLAVGGAECSRCGLRIEIRAVRPDATQTPALSASVTADAAVPK